MTNSTVEVVKKCCCGNFKELASQAVNDIKNRAGKAGMFLNWIEKLPNIQLANLDKMEEMVKTAKAGKYTDLAILGIGGSRHTTENITKLLGIDEHVHFFSSVVPMSFDRWISKLDLDKTLFLVVSKSGSTLETTVGY
jgi:glucose-6-phosphate isomerase